MYDLKIQVAVAFCTTNLVVLCVRNVQLNMDSKQKVNRVVCGEEVLAKNLKRHNSRQHSTGSSDEKSCSVLADESEANPPTSTSTEMHIDSQIVDEAVLMVLENHHQYTRKAMTDLLREHYPEIPQEAQHLFISVATYAARYVAGVEEIGRTASEAGSDTGAQAAKNVLRSMVSWRFGLWRSPRPPRPAVPSESVPESDASPGEWDSGLQPPSALSVTCTAGSDILLSALQVSS